jgi:hypothetical protein
LGTSVAFQESKPGPSGTTILAGFLTIIISLLYLILGGALVALGIIGRSASDVRDMITDAGPGLAELVNAFVAIMVLIGFVIFVLSLFFFIAGIKIIQRRAWARWFTIIFFFLFFLIWLGLLFSALNATEGQREGTLVTGAMATSLALIFLLLILPPTGNDFRRVREWERQKALAASPPAVPPMPPAAPPTPPAAPPAPPPQPPPPEQ